jgi:hypothetical protein
VTPLGREFDDSRKGITVGAEAQRQQLLSQQWQQAHETFRSNTSLLVQVWGVLIGGDAIVVGYGVSARSYAILLGAALIPCLMIVALYAYRVQVMPYIYLALDIERELKIQSFGTMHTFTKSAMPRSWRLLEPIVDMPDDEDRIAELRKVTSLSMSLKTGFVFALCCVAAIQVAVSILGYVVLGYGVI